MADETSPLSSITGAAEAIRQRGQAPTMRPQKRPQRSMQQSPSGGDPSRPPSVFNPPAQPQAQQQAQPQAQPGMTTGFDPAMLSDIVDLMPPTGEAANEVESNPIADFLLSAGQTIYRSGGGNPMVRGAMSAIGAAGRDIEEGGGESAVEAGAMAAADFASFGTFDTLAALDQAMGEDHDTLDSFTQSFADHQEAINQGLQVNREENPVSSVVGSVAGGILGGGGVGGLAMRGLGAGAKAIGAGRLTHNLLARTVSGSAIGAGEAALYRYNSDGSREEILQDAYLGALGGALFSAGGNLLGGLWRRVTGNNTSATERLTANELVRAFEASDARPPGQASPQELMDMVERNGAEATILEVYPEMRPLLQSVFNNPDATSGRRQLLQALAARNLTAVDFPTAVRDAVNIPRVRTQEEFDVFVRQRQNELQPQYDRVLDGMEERGITFGRRGLERLARNSLTDQGMIEQDYGQEALATFRRLVGNHSVRRTDDDGNVVTTVTPRGLHNISRDLGAAISRARDNKSPTRGLYALRSQIQQQLANGDDGYAALTRTYSDLSSQRDAFRQGYAMFGKPGTDSQALQRYMQDAASYTDVTAFVQGARRRLYERLNSANTPARMRSYLTENRRQLDNLRAVLGDEETNQIVESAMLAVRRQEAADNIARDARAPREERPFNPAQSGVRDAVMALRTGGFSSNPSPAAINAMARLIGAGRSPTQTDFRAGLIADTATAPAEQAGPLRQNLAAIAEGRNPTSQEARITGRTAPTGAAGGALSTALGQPDGQGTPAFSDPAAADMQSYLDALVNQADSLR